METFLERLRIKLGLKNLAEEQKAQLTEYLTEADTTIKLFLNLDVDSTIDDRFVSVLLDLAMLYYKRDNSNGVKSESYSEGGVSESVTHITSADYRSEEDVILQKIARYRRVNVRRKQKIFEEQG